MSAVSKRLTPESRQISTRRVASATSLLPQALKNSFAPPKVPAPKLRTGTCNPDAPNCRNSIFLRCSHKVGGYGLLWRSDERGVSGFTIFGSGGPGDGIFLEEGEKVVDGDGGAERAVVERGVRAACGRQRERRWAQPAAIDEAGDLTRVGKENGRAALTFLDFMSEKEEIGFGKI